MNIAILTSNHYRHKYFVNKISDVFNVAIVLAEEKSFVPTKYANDDVEEDIIKLHFLQRDQEEERVFDKEFKDGIDVRYLNKSSINSEASVKILAEYEIDYILVYGCGIISEHIIERYPNRLINMHLGLSPFYRGSGTNFFPIVNGEPEYCGVTIHYIDKGIDTGEILARARAPIAADDNIHSLGCKIIMVGIKVIAGVLHRLRCEEILPVPQDLSIGKTYYRKDFSAESVKDAWKNIENGLFKEYEQSQYVLLPEVEIISL